MRFPPFAHAQWLADAWQHGAPKYDLGASGFHSRIIAKHLPPIDVNDAAHMDLHAGTELREAIAKRAGVEPDSVRVTAGTSAANAAAIGAFARPGTRVVCERPTYMPLAHLATGFGAGLRFIDQPDGPDVDRMAAAIDRETSVVVLTSPNNPTQRAWTRDEMHALGDAAARHGAVVIVDQIYAELTDHARPDHDQIISTTGFNKCWGAPGLRIGWMVGAPARIAQAWDAHALLALAPSAYGVRAALAILPHEAAFRADLEAHLAEAHAAYRTWCETVGIDDEPRGITAFPRWPGDATAAARRFVEAGILTVPGEFFGAPDHLRLGFGSPGAAAALQQLAAVM